MKATEARNLPAGTAIKVTKVAPSQADVDDEERLFGQTGKISPLQFSRFQCVVDWDTDAPGSLMLASEDEVEVVSFNVETERSTHGTVDGPDARKPA